MIFPTIIARKDKSHFRMIPLEFSANRFFYTLIFFKINQPLFANTKFYLHYCIQSFNTISYGKKIIILITALLVLVGGATAYALIYEATTNEFKFCPQCGEKATKIIDEKTVGGETWYTYRCQACGSEFTFVKEAVAEGIEACTECADHNCNENE